MHAKVHQKLKKNAEIYILKKAQKKHKWSKLQSVHLREGDKVGKKKTKEIERETKTRIE